jgi:hypothetical protein
MAENLEAGADALQHLRCIFTQPAESAATVGARLMTWYVGMDLARKMLGQGSPKRLRRWRTLLRSNYLHFIDGTGRLKIFDLELKLLDLAEHLLALPSEQHMLQLLDQQREPSDLRRPRTEGPDVALLLCDHEILHRFKIERIEVRKRRGHHERSMS